MHFLFDISSTNIVGMQLTSQNCWWETSEVMLCYEETGFCVIWTWGSIHLPAMKTCCSVVHNDVTLKALIHTFSQETGSPPICFSNSHFMTFLCIVSHEKKAHLYIFWLLMEHMFFYFIIVLVVLVITVFFTLNCHAVIVPLISSRPNIYFSNTEFLCHIVIVSFFLVCRRH